MTNLIKIKNKIEETANFPKDDVVFQNVLPIFQNKETFKLLLIESEKIINDKFNNINTIAGIESRGFIFGVALAVHLNMNFIAIRKKGKLPGKTLSQEYKLEYGQDILEIKDNALNKDNKVLIVDDLLATGGTIEASYNLLNKSDCEIVGALFIIVLKKLNGHNKLSQINLNYEKIFEY